MCLYQQPDKRCSEHADIQPGTSVVRMFDFEAIDNQGVKGLKKKREVEAS